jgi:RecA-family ATPase
MKKLVITAIIALSFSGINAQTPNELSEWSCFKNDGDKIVIVLENSDQKVEKKPAKLAEGKDAYEWSSMRDDSPNLIKDDTKDE